MKLRIQHRTTYTYSDTVFFGPHRMMLRPREGHDLKIDTSLLEITPTHRIRWLLDAYGNSVALVDFTDRASKLTIKSVLTLTHFGVNPFDFLIEPEAVTYPFAYDNETALALWSLIQVVYPNDSTRVRAWVNQFYSPGQSIDSVALLQQMNGAIHRMFRYQARDEEGVQSPAITLEQGSGSCRDFATLFIEACRNLGLGARFVSGYLLGDAATSVGASTHAWAEVYLPGGGWRGFDPTLGLLTSTQHIPVAVSRHSEHAMPVSGSFLGPSSAFIGIDVDVCVEEIIPTPVGAALLVQQD